MSRLPVRAYVTPIALALLVLGLVGCGGRDESSVNQETVDAATPIETESVDDTATETAESGDTGSSEPAGPAPAPGKGSLVLDDGRTFALTITECEFVQGPGSPTAGTIEVQGTSEKGARFELTQFFLNGEWSQSDASIEFPNRDQIYVIVSSASADGEPATVDAKTITWTRTFKELDESANAHVYSGEGTLVLTCP